MMQGKGTFVLGSSGNQYKGYWLKGKMHRCNRQKLSSITGDEFIGIFVKGRATGWGRKMFSCGEVQVHVGMYKKNKRHGFGVHTWSSSDEYVRQWQYGRIFGRGVKSLLCSVGRNRIGCMRYVYEVIKINRYQWISMEISIAIVVTAAMAD